MYGKGQNRSFRNCPETKLGFRCQNLDVINHVDRVFLFTLSLFLGQQ